MPSIGEITKNGVTVEVEFDTRTENFSAKVGGKDLYSDSWSGLAAEVDKATKIVRQKISVPFTQVGYNRGVPVFKEGTATGLHSANGNVLVTWANGNREQMSRSFGYRPDHYRPLSSGQRDELIRLATAYKEAEVALRAFEEEHKIDLKDEVGKALKNAS